jgi:YD repeat-containing protein
MTSMTTVDGTTTYAYDDAGQLVSTDSDYTVDESYTYDDTGNRVTANGM